MSITKTKIKCLPKDGKLELGKVYKLTRGGLLVMTSEGAVQVGVPPETIKDTMEVLSDVPHIYCLPEVFFNRKKGITLAEVEFPIYYNFFIKQKKTIVVCREDKKSDLNQIVRAALFGPELYSIANDFLNSESTTIPSIQKETAFFTNHSVNDLVDFRAISNKEPVKIGKVTITVKAKKYIITDSKHKLEISVPFVVKYDSEGEKDLVSDKGFIPPYFGSTCLGASNGFDPRDITSGFIFWLGGKGVMVDPPANSNEALLRANVAPSLVKDVILTHTHADHDAGLFQKILSGEKIMIYTTNTVMDSWLNKYSVQSGMSVEKIKSLFNFRAVYIDEDVQIQGGIFRFSYTLHSIPTLGFRFKFANQQVVYSGDHLNDPKEYNILYEKGFLSEQRREEFKKFPWKSNIIFHEAGYPPLHTPVDYLNQLPEKTQKKISVYHIAEKDFPENTSLSRAKTGVEYTVQYKLNKKNLPSVGEQTFNKLQENTWFRNLKVRKKKFIDYFSEDQILVFKAGDVVIPAVKKDKLYYILSGVTGQKNKTTDEFARKYTAYQWVGRGSLMERQSSEAFVGLTDVVVVEIPILDFLEFVSDKDVFISQLSHLRKVIGANYFPKERSEVLKQVSFLKELSLEQKTAFESLLEPVRFASSKTIIEKGKVARAIYLYHSGLVSQSVKLGDVIGDCRVLAKKVLPKKSVQVEAGAILFKIDCVKLKEFLILNPGAYIRAFDF